MFIINFFSNKFTPNKSSNLFTRKLNKHRHISIFNIFNDEVKDRVIFSFFVVYAVVIALIILEYSNDISPYIPYIIPLITVNIASPQLGLLQQKIYNTFICLLYGAFFGYLISYVENIYSFIIAFFFVTSWICTYKPWSKIPSAIGTLTITLIYIFKIRYHASSGYSTRLTLCIMLLPMAISMGTLLFPVPQLTFFKSKKKMISLSYSISSLINNAIDSFLSCSNYELFNAEFEHNISTAVADLKILKIQQGAAKNEILFYYYGKDYVGALELYIETTSLILSELQSISQVLKEIVHNKTHELYAEKLSANLRDFTKEIEILLILVTEFLDLFQPTPFRFFYWSRQLGSCIYHSLFTSKKKKFRNYFNHYYDAQVTIKLLENYKSSISYDRDESEINYYYFNGIINSSKNNLNVKDENIEGEVDSNNYNFEGIKKKIHEEMDLSVNRLLIIRSKILHSFIDLRNTFQFTPIIRPTDCIIKDEELYSIIYEENKQLGLKNFGPRGAFIHRISIIVESFINFRLVLKAKHDYFFIIKTFSYDLVHPIIFFGENMLSVYYFFKICLEIFDESRKGHLETRNEMIKTHGNQLIKNIIYLIYLIKPTLICLIPLCLFLYQKLDIFFNGGMWFFIFTVIIRQETVSSSFIVGYQRLEGTVIGAMYSFFIYQNINIDIGERLNFERQLWVFLPWLCFCSFFRLGPLRGYSATVASFTPIVLLYGYPYGINSCWGRIQETVFAVGLYLVFDNLILPARTYTLVSSSVLKCIDYTKSIVTSITNSLDVLNEFEILSRTICESNKIDKSSKKHVSSELDNQNLSQVVLNGENIDGVGVYGTISDIRDVSAGTRANDMVFSERKVSEGKETSYHVSTNKNVEVSQKNDLVIEDPRDNIRDILMVSTIEINSNERIQQLIDSLMGILGKSSESLSNLKSEIAFQEVVLKLVRFEPQLLWHRGFPEQHYKNLLLCFTNFYEATLVINSGIRALIVILSQMILRKEDVSPYMRHFQFIIDYLKPISSRAGLALEECATSFTKLYKQRDYSFDLRNLLQLRIDCEKFKFIINKDYITILTTEAPMGFKNYNPYFVCAWQNLFETVELYLIHLLKLGMCLQMIKNVEALE